MSLDNVTDIFAIVDAKHKSMIAELEKSLEEHKKELGNRTLDELQAAIGLVLLSRHPVEMDLPGKTTLPQPAHTPQYSEGNFGEEWLPPLITEMPPNTETTPQMMRLQRSFLN